MTVRVGRGVASVVRLEVVVEWKVLRAEKSKIALTCFSESPTHLLRRSEAVTDMKAALAAFAAPAARDVFPVPGGPWRRMHFQG
jgi:hypothetical protein